MPGPTTTWQRKLDRAQEHFDLFMAEFHGQSARFPYKVIPRRHSDPRLLTLHLGVEQFPDYERWSLVLGDCIHNLRSTLDHLIYAVAVKASGSNPPPDHKTLSYPLRATQFWHLADLQQNQSFMTEFQRLQPISRPEWKGLRLLAVLEELDNFDKHRTLNVVVAQHTSLVFSLMAPGYFPTYKDVTTNFAPLEPGTELVRIMEPEPIPDVDVEWRHSIAPLIGHDRASDGREHSGAIDLIEALFIEVEVVIRALRSFL